MTTCSLCGRKLKSPESVRRGYGPICASLLASSWTPAPGDERFEVVGATVTPELAQAFRKSFDAAIDEADRRLGSSDYRRLKTSIRQKAVTSILSKSHGRMKDKPLRLMDDVVGVRLLCRSLEEQRVAVRRLVGKNTSFDIVSAKDFVSAPTHLGYRAIHLLARSSDGKPIEIQVRTKRQDIFAGVAHDRVYKGPLKNNEPVKKYLAAVSGWLNERDEGIDTPFPKPSETAEKRLLEAGILADVLDIEEKAR